jgi:hypothetical protein
VGCVSFDRTKNLIIVNMAIESPDSGELLYSLVFLLIKLFFLKEKFACCF